MAKKIRIYLISFLISFMVIYSIYYYQRAKNLQGGFVALADNSPFLHVAPIPAEPSNKNILFNAGTVYTLIKNKIEIGSASYKDYSQLINENQYVGKTGILNSTLLDQIDEEVQNRFPKHPPIQLQTAKEGENILFSYVFKNVELPECFGYAEKSMDFNGKKVKYIIYQPAKDNKNQFEYYQSLDKSNQLCRMELDGGDVLTIYSAGGSPDLVTAWKDANFIYRNYPKVKRFNNEFILFPLLDLFITKHYNQSDMDKYFMPSQNNFKYVEDRLKFRLGIRDLKSVNEKIDTSASTILNKKMFISVSKKEAIFPYIAIMVNTADILKK